MSALVQQIVKLAAQTDNRVAVSRVSVSLETARELVAEFLDQLTTTQNPATLPQIELCDMKQKFLETPFAVTRQVVDAGFFVGGIRIEVGNEKA